MPKAHRYFVTNQHYHLTHRCHDRSFLLRFAKDRDTYREMMRNRLKRFRTSLLAYCIEQRIMSHELEREAMWTERLAVGSKRFTQEISDRIQNRRQLDIEEAASGESGTWILKESTSKYA